MPDLERQNLQTAFTEAGGSRSGFGKFVRVDDKIYWDAQLSHKEIVAISQISNPDDAGRFSGSIVDGKQTFNIYGPSSDLNLPKTPEQRNQTLEIWREISKDSDFNVKPQEVEDVFEAWMI